MLLAAWLMAHFWLPGILLRDPWPCRLLPTTDGWTAAGLMLCWIRFKYGMVTLDTGSEFSLLKPQLHCLHGWTKDNRTLETQEYNSMKIMFSTTWHPTMQASENSFSQDIARTPPPAAIEERRHSFLRKQFYYLQKSNGFIIYKSQMFPHKHFKIQQ